MNDVERVKSMRRSLARQAAERYRGRTAERSAKLAEVQKYGVMAAAGTAGIFRAAHMTVAEGRTLEAITGQNDMDQVNFLERGMRAAKAVCRILIGGEPIGTGFLVGPGLLITNHHVIPDRGTAQNTIAEFDFQLDADEKPLAVTRFALDPGRIFVTSPVERCDFTLAAIRPAPNGLSIGSFGWLPLDSRTEKALEGEPIVIIEHPAGQEKRLCLFDSTLVDRVDQYLQYTTDTEPGSSGSPAFNRHWQLVGLHHASATTDQIDKGQKVVVNEGIRTSAILEALRTPQGLEGDPAPALAVLTDPKTLGDGRPARVTIAVTVDGTGGLESGTKIRTRPASHYDGRPGYDPAFLGPGLEVPLPALPEGLFDNDTVRLLDDPEEAELKYEHYSVVLSKSRKLAYFSAANIDGATVERLSRTDRDPDHPLTGPEDLEAADIWYFDSRIRTADQVGAPIYDKTAFDFGHQTRRLDPVWGDSRTKRIANDDTFHMTNCAPQHKNLNEITWAHLEDAVLDAAVNAGVKFTVITGPVLDPRDPVILDVAVPLAFYKVIAFEDPDNPGQLKSMGFMQWQDKLVAEVQASLESLDELSKAQQWRVAVREIGRVTSLDFGPLVDADEVSAGDAHPERLSDGVIARLFARAQVAEAGR